MERKDIFLKIDMAKELANQHGGEPRDYFSVIANFSRFKFPRHIPSPETNRLIWRHIQDFIDTRGADTFLYVFSKSEEKK